MSTGRIITVNGPVIRAEGMRNFAMGEMVSVGNLSLLGEIIRLDGIEQVLTVRSEGREIDYSFLELDELTHAYAISVHKAQGSEYPAVVLPLLTQHYMMLQRNLLYTAVTRAKKLAILVGTRRAIAIAVKNNKTTERHTALDWRLNR